MGLFSSSTRTVVGTQVSRVIKDSLLPNALKTGLTNALYSGDEIPASMMEALVGSVGIRAERMYEYGRTQYAHGLPSGAIYSAMEGQAEVTAVLNAAEGSSVLLEYSHYRPRNFLHIGWLSLIATKGYNPTTNQLSVVSAEIGRTVYLNDMAVVIPAGHLADYQPGALELWGTPARAGYTPLRKFQGSAGALRAPTPVVSDPAATEVHIRVEYIWEGDYSTIEGKAPVFTGSFDLPVSGYDATADYFHAKYTVGGVTKYVMYKSGSGTYPTLDRLFNQPVVPTGTFFPFAYFRYNHASEIENKTTAAYKTSKKLVKYLGMDFDTVASAIDGNPGIADVQQVMVILAVPASTENELEQRYLFSFFDNLFASTGNQYTTPSIAHNAVASQLGREDLTKTSLVIQDKRFKMALSNAGVFKKRVSGQIGAVGSHTSSVESVMVEEQYTTGWFNDNAVAIRMMPIPVHTYRRQINKVMYDEIQVYDLKMLYYVSGEYFVTASGASNILLIPVDHAITADYSITERETFYSRSLHFVFNSMQITTLEWYQTSLFGAIMTMASFVIICLSLGSATGPVSALLAALEAGSTVLLSAAVIALIQQLLIGFLIGFVLKLFVKAVGGEVAVILAIVAMVWAGYDAYAAGSLSGAPWAQTLLQISSGLSKAVSANVQDMMKDLLSEYQSFNLFKDETTKQLEAANKLLEHKNWLNPFVIFGEKPDDYYNRTVHSGNIGIAGISAISSYVDIALTLPKLDQSIGETTYE